MTPEDIHEMLIEAKKLLINKWGKEKEISLKNRSNEFNKKISAVKSLISESASTIINENQINI